MKRPRDMMRITGEAMTETRVDGQWVVAKQAGLKDKMTKPPISVRRDRTGPKGQLQGTVAVDPQEEDQIARRQHGNIGD